MSKEMIHIIVSTHEGRLYDEMCDHVVIKAPDGEFAVYPNHIPVVTSFDFGFIKLVRDKDIYFISLASCAIAFNKNEMTVLAQEAHIGTNPESAKAHLEQVRKERLENNRKLDADYTEATKEMADNIKKAKAGNL